MTSGEPKPVSMHGLDLLEEDDEFEEFPMESKFIQKLSPPAWVVDDELPKDVLLWEDNWDDDDDVDENFINQLRAELKHSGMLN